MLFSAVTAAMPPPRYTRGITPLGGGLYTLLPQIPFFSCQRLAAMVLFLVSFLPFLRFVDLILMFPILVCHRNGLVPLFLTLVVKSCSVVWMFPILTGYISVTDIALFFL